jgi:hypothetical protein
MKGKQKKKGGNKRAAKGVFYNAGFATNFCNSNNKGIRYMLSLGFEEYIELIFKLLNARVLQNPLIPSRS